MNTSLVKPRRGRPSDPDKLIFITIGLRRSHWEWLSLWFPSGSPTDQIGALFERSMKFWPCGPFVFGHVRKLFINSCGDSISIGGAE